MSTILCRIPNHVGDCCMCLPALRLLEASGYTPALVGKRWAEDLMSGMGWRFDPESLENGINGIMRSSIYYCDPMRSGQKGGIEQAHTMLRMILPKKTSFEYLTQWDLRAIVDHINSTPRESLGGRTPYDVALENYGIDILKALQLRPIPPDEVNLTPKLIRFNH